MVISDWIGQFLIDQTIQVLVGTELSRKHMVEKCSALAARSLESLEFDEKWSLPKCPNNNITFVGWEDDKASQVE